jgi:mRNA-degrading endonuclease RelE of RelBE toxin-antitoxin system
MPWDGGRIIEGVMSSEPYDIQYTVEAVDDVRALRPFDQRAVLEGIEIHLLHQPKFVSKSRIKLMTQPFWSQYRLRIVDFRVYYDVDDDGRIVNVLRILAKTTDQTPEAPP